MTTPRSAAAQPGPAPPRCFPMYYGHEFTTEQKRQAQTHVSEDDKRETCHHCGEAGNGSPEMDPRKPGCGNVRKVAVEQRVEEEPDPTKQVHVYMHGPDREVLRQGHEYAHGDARSEKQERRPEKEVRKIGHSF